MVVDGSQREDDRSRLQQVAMKVKITRKIIRHGRGFSFFKYGLNL